MKPIYKLLDWIDINKLDFCGLSLNENDKAFDLLKENQDKINWYYLSCNENIFELDYEKMKDNFQILGNEILEKALDPDRIKRLSIIYNFKFEDWFI